MALIKGEVRRWLADEVTVELIDRVQAIIDTLDKDVHSVLLDGKEHFALAPNARMQQCKEILIVMYDLLEDAEGE